MPEKEHLKFSNAVLLVPMVAILLIWTVFWVEIQFHINLNHFGIYPRSFRGLIGIICSPFIHGSIEHLYNNTIPLAVLTASLIYFYKSVAFRILTFGILFSGLLTWIIGRPSYHIGASGLIYVLASFIFFKGIFTKHYRLVALSLAVVFLYGGLLWYIFPVEDGISWEGHLAGFLTGLLMAFFVRADIPEVKKYAWEQEDYNEEEDEFLKHFDEDGNFIENIESGLENEDDGLKIKYYYKKDSKGRSSEN